MEYRKFGDTYLVRVDRGEEILASLTELGRKEDIRLASVEGLGGVDRAAVCVYDVATRTFSRKEFREPMEMTGLTGTISRMKGQVYLHVHANLCDQELKVHGGHASELWVGATCEMVVRVLPGEVDRRYDPDTGLNILEFS